MHLLGCVTVCVNLLWRIKPGLLCLLNPYRFFDGPFPPGSLFNIYVSILHIIHVTWMDRYNKTIMLSWYRYTGLIETRFTMVVVQVVVFELLLLHLQSMPTQYAPSIIIQLQTHSQNFTFSIICRAYFPTDPKNSWIFGPKSKMDLIPYKT